MGQYESEGEVVQHVPHVDHQASDADMGTVVRVTQASPVSDEHSTADTVPHSPELHHPVRPPSLNSPYSAASEAGLSPGADNVLLLPSRRDSWAHDNMYRLSGSSYNVGSQLTARRVEPRPAQSSGSCLVSVRDVAGKVGYGVVPVCSFLVALRSWGEERVELGVIAATAVCASILLSDWLYSHTAAGDTPLGADGLSLLDCDSDNVRVGMSAETARLLKNDIKRSPDRPQMQANLASNLAALSEQRLRRNQQQTSMRAMLTQHALPTLTGSFLPLVPLLALRSANNSSDNASSHLSQWAYLAMVAGFSLALLLAVTLIARRGDSPLWVTVLRTVAFLFFSLAVAFGTGELVHQVMPVVQHAS